MRRVQQLILGGVLLSAAVYEVGYGADAVKPNIVFVLVDDMGWSDTSVPFDFDEKGQERSAPGNKIFKTPAIQQLANQGVRFTNAYAASVCSPSRTAIMSGCNPARTHITNWTNPDRPSDTSGRSIKSMKAPQWKIEGLNETKDTLAKMFKKEGYRTIFVGKAHFGPTSEAQAQPSQLGFDVSIAGSGAGHPGSYYGKDNYAEMPRRNNVALKLGPRDIPNMDPYYGSDVFLTDALTNKVTASMDESVKQGKPFFAYFSHYAVHSPLMMDPQFEKDYPDIQGGMKKYATLMSGVDKSVGQIFKKLDELGVAENTLIVFASDNGGTAPTQRPCAPLRAKKGTPYEGGLRTPLMIAWAKPDPTNKWQKKYPIKPGSHQDNIVALMDLYATFGSMIGSKSIPKSIDSQDFSGLLTQTGKTSRPQTYFLNFPHEHEDAYYIVYREGDWKVIYRFHTKKWELYNLKEDLGEHNDLSTKELKKLKSMANGLVREFDRHGSQAPIDTATKQPATIVLPALSQI